MAGLSDMMPQVSRVTRTLDNFVCMYYGLGGLGKTPVACNFPKPIYFAFGKSGLSGLNDVRFYSIKNWSDFRKYVNFFANPQNYDELHEEVQTIVLDELEVAFQYLETYLCSTQGVAKIGEMNSGYGGWKELEDEWSKTMLKLFGSGFSIVNILHTTTLPDSTKQFPAGNKRMLPVILNHSDVIGYVKGNGLDADGKPIHSSLILTDCDECFARTRNEYIGLRHPIIEDFTAENLIEAYFDGIDAQSEIEGVKPISKQEQDKMFEEEKIDFKDLMEETTTLCADVSEKVSKDKVFDVIEGVLGKDKKLSGCTEKNYEAVKVIRDELRAVLDAEVAKELNLKKSETVNE